MGGKTQLAYLAACLLGVAAAAAARESAAATAVPVRLSSTARFDAAGRIQVDVHYDCALKPPTGTLAAAGLTVNTAVAVPPLCAIEGWVAPAALAGIARISGVTSIELPRYALRRLPRPGEHAQALGAGSIDGNGVSIMHADQFVSQTGITGAGVTVGVQSTGVSSLSLIQSRGELPMVQVVDPSGGGASGLADEGTVLLEEVHAVAPGAALAFCGPQTFVQYVSCLQQLVGAGASVLVDDISFPPDDLMSSDTTDATTIQAFLAQNPQAALFSAVGNNNGTYWEGAYAPVSLASLGQAPLACTLGNTTQSDSYVAQFGASASQTLTVSTTSTFPLVFAWADPAGANVSDFDVYWFDASTGEQLGCILGSAQSGNQVTQNLTLGAGSYTMYVATPDATLAGKFLKLWLGGDGLTALSTSTSGSIVAPQAFASGVLTVGAVNGSDGIGNGIESFSSLGPITVEFPSPAQLQGPTFVAPDGIYVDASGTYFEGYIFPDGNFYGTSASVPNAAAVAALLRGAFPSLSVAQLVTALESGAAPLGEDVVPDDTFGYGRIDAIGALGTIPSPTISALQESMINAAPSSAPYPFTVSGTGPLHFTVTSSNPQLVPPSIVSSGAAGVTISPANCGETVLACTLTVTPASGVGGTAQLTIAVVDGANRSATASMMVDVTNPVGQQMTAASNAGGTGGGGALDAWTLAWLAVLGALSCASRAMRVPSGRLKLAQRNQGARP